MTAQLSREEIEAILKQCTPYHANCISPVSVRKVQSMARMLLAGMESEPVAYFYPGDETEWQGVALTEELDDEQKARCIPLYAAPPAPVAVPTFEEWSRGCKISLLLCDSEFREVAELTWNEACAAMLKARPVTATTVPDGWKLVPVESTNAMLDAAYSHPASTEDRMRKQYSSMLAAAPAAPNGWIKCSERMPETDVWVLICNIKSGGVDMGIYRNDEHLEDDEHWQNEQGEPIEAYSSWPVTHWMPLPPAPEQEV